MKTISMYKKTGVVLTAMTIIITVVFITFGMFSNKLGGVAYAAVAKPETKLVGEGTQTLTLDKGMTGTYRFYVTNKDGDSISQVKMKYKINVTTASGYTGSVRYSLFHCNADGSYDSSQDQIGNAGEGGLIDYTDDKMEFSKEVETTHHYILQFYPDTIGDFGFDVTVTSEQVD